MSEKYIGKSIERFRGIEKATGKLKYTGDRIVNDAIHVSIIRSPHAHAKIISVQKSEAYKIQGVLDILCFEDFKGEVPTFGSVEKDQPILADGYAKYYGEPVVAIVAISKIIAKKASKLVEIKYEKIDAFVDFENLKQSGLSIEDKLYKEYKYGWGEKKEKPFLELKNKFTYQSVFQFPIENFVCIAEPIDDYINIYTPIQHPFIMRRVLSKTFNLAMSKIRVISDEIGGAFGSKGYPKIEPLATYIALKHKRTVVIELSMKEGFLSTRRIPAEIDIVTGYDSNGKLLYQEINSSYLMGAYVDAAPRVVAKSSYLCSGPYKIPYTKMQAKLFYSNTVPCSAFRGFGMPQIMFAIESQMNIAAKKLGLDGHKIRLINLPNKGDSFIPGDTPCDGNWKEVLSKACELIQWNEKLPCNTGKSIAIGIKSGIHGSVSNALVKLHSDGTATGFCGSTDMGQGVRTIFAQMIAERLMIPIDSVKMVLGDSELAPFDLATAGSRTTVSMGTALVNACDDVTRQLEELVKSENDSSIEIVKCENGFSVNGSKKTYEELLQHYFGLYQGEIIGQGRFIGKRVNDHPLGGHADFWEFIVMAANVSIDIENFSIIPNKISTVSDIGKVINPKQAHGQESGGLLMGIGQALSEEIKYSKEGIMLNGNPIDYKVPSIKDVTYEISSAFIENADGPGPYGSKGIAESSAIPVGPLITGAILDATDQIIYKLPIDKEKIFSTLLKANK